MKPYSQFTLRELTTPITQGEVESRKCPKEDNTFEEEKETTWIHEIAHEQKLDQVNPKFLTRETLTVLDRQNQTPIHKAAEHGDLRQIPSSILADLDFLISLRNQFNETPLHLAFLNYNDNSNPLPPEILEHLKTKKALTDKGYHNQTILHLLAENSQIKIVPKQTFQDHPEIIDVQENNERTPIHTAARNKCLYQFPDYLFTQERIYQRDRNKETVIHCATYNRAFDQIPKKFLTKRNLIDCKHERGLSILDAIMLQPEELNRIPISILALYQPDSSERKKIFQRVLEIQPNIAKSLKNYKLTNKLKKEVKILK